MSRPDAVAKRAQARESTRELLISAAVELLSERGTIGLTMTAVARRADVAVRTVYNHFPSADRLVDAAMSTVTKKFAALRPRTALLERTTPAEGLRQFVQQWFAELSRQHMRIDALLSVRGSTELDAAFAAADELRLRHLRTLLSHVDRRDALAASFDEAVAVAFTATSYQAWSRLVPSLGLGTDEAADLVVRWVLAFAFRPDASLDVRTSQPGGRVGVDDVDEEGPDSAGQGGG